MNVEEHLAHRQAERIRAMMDDWMDEASAAAVAGNPRRADYLEYMASRAPTLVREAEERERNAFALSP